MSRAAYPTRVGSTTASMPIVLLSAPADVILERIENRTTNKYGKDPGERALVLADLDSTEPRLRRTCTHEIDATKPVDEVVEALIGIGRLDGPSVDA